MIGNRKSKWFKLILVVLIFLFLYQTEYVLGLNISPDINKQFEEAKEAFLKEEKDKSNYQTAKQILERLTLCLGQSNKEQKQLLGKVYLLLGAIYEKLKESKKAKDNYKKAKNILNSLSKSKIDENEKMIAKVIAENPIEGIRLNDLKYYRKYYMKAKKKFPVLLAVSGAVILGVVLALLLKKKKEYTLTVTLEEGVEGTPGAGTHTYEKGESVNYIYSLRPGYDNLAVFLNGNEESTSGTIVMNRNHILNATATVLNDNPPTVVFRSPLNADVISGGNDFVVHATDDIGIKKIEFYINDVLFNTVTETNYPPQYISTETWQTASYPDGVYLLKAIAYDTINQTGEDQITVTVNNQIGVDCDFHKDKIKLQVMALQGKRLNFNTGEVEFMSPYEWHSKKRIYGIRQRAL